MKNKRITVTMDDTVILMIKKVCKKKKVKAGRLLEMCFLSNWPKLKKGIDT